MSDLQEPSLHFLIVRSIRLMLRSLTVLQTIHENLASATFEWRFTNRDASVTISVMFTWINHGCRMLGTLAQLGVS